MEKPGEGPGDTVGADKREEHSRSVKGRCVLVADDDLMGQTVAEVPALEDTPAEPAPDVLSALAAYGSHRGVLRQERRLVARPVRLRAALLAARSRIPAWGAARACYFVCVALPSLSLCLRLRSRRPHRGDDRSVALSTRR
jgi:hypothetical protein